MPATKDRKMFSACMWFIIIIIYVPIYLYNLSIYLIIYLFRKVNAKHKGREDVLDLYVDLSMDLSLYISIVSIYLIINLFREEIRTLPSTRARRMSWTCPQAVSRLFTHSFYFHLFIYMLTQSFHVHKYLPILCILNSWGFFR